MTQITGTPNSTKLYHLSKILSKELEIDLGKLVKIIDSHYTNAYTTEFYIRDRFSYLFKINDDISSMSDSEDTLID